MADRLKQFSGLEEPPEEEAVDSLASSKLTGLRQMLQETAPQQETPQREETDDRREKIRGFLRDTSPDTEFEQPGLETAQPESTGAQAPSPEGLPSLDDASYVADETLGESQRLALDMLTLQAGARGQMPLSKTLSVRNSLMQGLGDFASGIPTFVSAAIRELSFKEQFARARGEEIEPITESMMYKSGQWIKKNIEEIFPENPEYQGQFLSNLARGAGTLGAQAATTALTGGAASIPIMAASFSGMEYEQALEETGDEDTAFQTMLLNVPINSVEAIPVITALTRLDKYTGGGLKKTIKGSLKVGLQEAVLETGQTYAQNFVAREMYDSTRQIAEGASEGGLIGFTLGLAMGGMSLSLRSRAENPNASVSERLEAENTLRLIDESLTERGDARGVYSQVGAKTTGARVGRSYSAAKAAEFEKMTRYRPEDYNMDLTDGDTGPVFYHGTQNQFDEFDPAFLGEGTDADDAQLGFHFTDNQEVASRVFGEGGHTKKVNLKMEKTWEPMSYIKDPTPEQASELYYVMTGERVDPKSPEFEEVMSVLDSGEIATRSSEFKSELGQDAEGVRSRLKELGYDSIKLPLTTTDVLAADQQGVTDLEGSEYIILDTKNIRPVAEQKAETNSTRSLLPKAVPPKTRFGKFIQKSFSDLGRFPDPIRRTIRKSHALGQKFMYEIQTNSRDFQKGLRETYGVHVLRDPFKSGKIPDADFKAMQHYLDTGEGITNLPAKMRGPLRSMRLHIDRMSEMGIQIGLFEGKVKATVAGKKGSYLYRTYKKHQYGEKWEKMVPADARNNAKVWLTEQYEKQGMKKSEAQIDELIRKLLLVDDSPVSILGKDLALYKRVSDLKGRTQLQIGNKRFKEIPKAIQELWGVETNPLINYVNSAQKLANLVTAHGTLQSLRRDYEGVYFFDPAKTSPQEMTEKSLVALGEVEATTGGIRTAKSGMRTQEALDMVEFAPGEDIRVSPLDGMWTTREIKQAFTEMTRFVSTEGHPYYRFFLRGNAAAKVAATVLSPRTFVRNYFGAGLLIPAQGHIRLRDVKESWDASMNIFRNSNTKEGRELFSKLVDLGLIGKGAKPGELRDLIRDFDPNFSETNMMNLAGGRLTKKLKKGVLRTSQAYELGDTFFRVQMFYLERARYKKADPNTTDEQVAELVNEIYQDYSRSPNALKSLRRNAAFAPFVSFHYEILRTSVATVKQIKHELRHENRAVKKIGAQRLAGFSLIAGAGSAAFARVMQYMFGIPESIMDALRDHSAPWDKNSTLVPVDIFRGGGRYINSTYTDPYEVIKEPFKMFVQGALSEDQFLEKSYQAMLKAFEPALSPELYTKAVAEAALNRRNLEDPNSSRIYNPEDSGVDKVMSRLAHVWDAVEPGFLKQGGQIIEALGDEEDAPGALEAFSALMGQRIVKIDTQETLPFKARDYSTTVRNLRSSYTKKVREGELSLLEEARELNRINQRKLEEFQKVEKSIETAFRLGLDWEEIKEALVQGGMSGVEAERIWNGEFVPFEYLEEEE